MPRFEITSPDGKKFEINAPEGATQDQALEFARSQFSQQQPKGDTLQLAPQPSGMDNFLGGLKKAGSDTLLGVKQLGAMAGLGDSQALAQEAAQNKIRDAELMNSTGGMIGNAVGNVGMALLPGGALKLASKAAPALSGVANALLAPKSLKGAAALGAGLGVVQPAVNNEERITNAAISGLGGAGGMAAMNGVSRLLNPQTDKAVTALMNQGVRLTPGQILGGTTKKVEDAATSSLGLGHMIRARQQDSIEDFNKAALNKTLAPIGEKITSTGREAVEEAGKKISAAYESVLPKVALQRNQGFDDAVLQSRQAVASLPAEHQATFEKIINDQLANRFTPQGFMRGHAFKEAESEIGRVARGYMGDPVYANRELGHALQNVQAGLRDLLATQNPQYAPQLKAANEAWANLTRVEGAAGGVGAKGGVFTPSQLASSVRGQDKTLRHRGYAKGQAVMQDLSDMGEKVLPRTVPDSGTAERQIITNLLAGGGMYAGGAPAVAATGVAASLYTPQAQKVISALLTQRPDIARQLGYAFQKGAPMGAIPGAALANSQE